jgi:glutamate dehydrogenase
MSTGTQAVESELIESVCERVRERVAPEEVQEAEAFVRAYYKGAPAEDLRGREPVDLYGAALSHWTFGRERTAGTALVRVYNPTFEQHGWQSPHTAIDIVSDDMPFLVDSVSMELSRREAGIHVLVHPVIGDESYMHIEVDRQAGGFDELADALRHVLGQVRATVEDWQPMKARLQELIDEPAPAGVDAAEVEEAKALLAWVGDHHFTFLGYREYSLEGDALRADEGTGLGLLRGGVGHVSTAFAKLPPAVRAFALEPHPLVITKANARSPVHRPAYLDYIGVKRFDADGNVVGERRFLGLYTGLAYRARPLEIPILRRTVGEVLDRAGFPPGSHDYKALNEIIDTFPRDELFQMTADELFEVARGILDLGERQRVRLFLRTDRYERFVSCLVYLPRDRFNTANRLRIGAILSDALGAESTDSAPSASLRIAPILRRLAVLKRSRGI